MTHIMLMIHARIIEFLPANCAINIFSLMFFGFMSREFSDSDASDVANGALVLLRGSVGEHVSFEEIGGRSLVSAFLAGERSLARVGANVVLQEAAADVRIVAKRTKKFVHGVVLRLDMRLQGTLRQVAVGAVHASEWA